MYGFDFPRLELSFGGSGTFQEKRLKFLGSSSHFCLPRHIQFQEIKQLIQ